LRTDDVLLKDMLLASQRVAKHIESTVPGFKEAHLEIPWKRLIGLRNFYVHAYERLDANEVWATARRFVPRIGEQIGALIPPEDDPAETNSQQ
jgi:uncharacterized protein with HEPN domain